MINPLNVANIVLRLPLYSSNNLRHISTYVHPLYFRATNILLGEPLKKKKRLDPAIIRAREERKRKRLEKQIRRFEKYSHQLLKPLSEIDELVKLVDEKNTRSRHPIPLSKEEIRERTLLEREWCNYKRDQWLKDLQIIKSIVLSQERALKELKAVSNQLYKKAVEFDELYLPYNAVGPVHTPPISNYDSPDGEYIETTVKYVGED